jgi:hypothetical protein
VLQAIFTLSRLVFEKLPAIGRPNLITISVSTRLRNEFNKRQNFFLNDKFNVINKGIKSLSKKCRNEDLAITVYKSESRKTTCCGILLCLLDHSYVFTLLYF